MDNQGANAEQPTLAVIGSISVQHCWNIFQDSARSLHVFGRLSWHALGGVTQFLLSATHSRYCTIIVLKLILGVAYRVTWAFSGDCWNPWLLCSHWGLLVDVHCGVCMTDWKIMQMLNNKPSNVLKRSHSHCTVRVSVCMCAVLILMSVSNC